MRKQFDYASFFQIDQIHKMGITGKGIGVAILDTGVANHKDLRNITCFKDYVNHRLQAYDDSGHGTHVCGIVGSKKVGVAPECNVIMLKVLNARGEGKTTNVLKALDFILTHQKHYNIRIVNISIGSISQSQSPNTVLLQAVNAVWDAGIIVTSAAGNQGPAPFSITTPGISRKIITVGACDDTLTGSRKRNYSGRGPTFSCIRKPDIVAPGSRIVSCSNYRNGYTEKSGTSMATPFVSGVLALLLGKEPELTPKQAKLRLYETAYNLNLDPNYQGFGLINPFQLLS